jgi:hypothetical protein
MGFNRRTGWVAVCMFAVAGCGGGSEHAIPSDPAAQAASEFLDAVLKGDSQRASSWLTPLAVQRIAERGEQFAPPGDDGTVGFRVGQVVRPNQTDALVQCILTESPPNKPPQETEVYCLLRLVDGQWRVAGIAHTSGPNNAAMILDFETGQDVPLPTPAEQAHVAARPSAPPAAETSPSPRQ